MSESCAPVIRLSHELAADTPLYGGKGRLELVRSQMISAGDSSNNTAMAFPAHCGTHVDAPLHFDPKGLGLTDFPADFWFCLRPFLLEVVAEPEEIFCLDRWRSLLEEVPPETDLLLIKTGFEQYRWGETQQRYVFSGPGFSPEIGIWLRQNRNLKMLGFDFISLTSYGNRPLGREAHRAFLGPRAAQTGKGELRPPILLIEDMKLSELSRAPRQVVVAPLLYMEADGAPATVFATL